MISECREWIVLVRREQGLGIFFYIVFFSVLSWATSPDLFFFLEQTYDSQSIGRIK